MAQHHGVTSSNKRTAPDERRRFPRHKTLNVGVIAYPDGRCVDCTILDISVSGARIRLDEYSECPTLFTLRVGSGRSYRGQFAWQNKHELGFKFLSASQSKECGALRILAQSDPRELPKVLLVDDDDNALAIYEKELSKHFDVKTAKSAEQGLVILDTRGPFAVVVSDMRMPAMNGARFLGAVGKRAPDTVRIMLTGYSDLNTAMEAINLGHVYCFMTKPCSLKELVRSIKEGADQYRGQVMAHMESPSGVES